MAANASTDIAAPSAHSGTNLLVLVAPMSAEQLHGILANLTVSFPPEDLLIATPDADAVDSYPALRILSTPTINSSWILSASDFVNACDLAHKHEASAILMLGPESNSLRASALGELANPILTGATDLAVPCYDLPPHAALVNSAIFYPLSRTLFASRMRYPLAIDLGLSLRMAEHLALAAQRFLALKQGDSQIWPISEAAVGGFASDEIQVGTRVLPHPNELDLNTVLPLVTGSLFADIDAKAAFWQHYRALPSQRCLYSQTPSNDAVADISPMIEGFRLAYTSLQEIWSLVLPPNTLLGLKRLSLTDAASFRMPENLWARIVFDFLLAYRLRTINRGHLLGALIPLYRAWVASHINITTSGTDAERHIESVAAAFETDKPYLLSRWRWPDRFNP